MNDVHRPIVGHPEHWAVGFPDDAAGVVYLSREGMVRLPWSRENLPKILFDSRREARNALRSFRQKEAAPQTLKEAIDGPWEHPNPPLVLTGPPRTSHDFRRILRSEYEQVSLVGDDPEDRVENNTFHNNQVGSITVGTGIHMMATLVPPLLDPSRGDGDRFPLGAKGPTNLGL